MQVQSSKPSPQLFSVIAKIDQLLRLYQMSKKTDTTKKNLVQKTAKALLKTIQNQPEYQKILSFLSQKFQLALQDINSLAKTELQIANILTTKPSSNCNKEEKLLFDQTTLTKNATFEERQQKQSRIDQCQGSREETKEVETGRNKQKNKNSSLTRTLSQLSNDKSEDNNLTLLMDNLSSICHQHAGHMEQVLAFNQDIFSTLRQTNDQSVVYLFGVNNPERKTIKKLYACTLMKFTQSEVANLFDHNENKFQKEAKIFQNNLRAPLGLIMSGTSIQDISLQHIRFLAGMRSVLGVIVLIQNWKECKRGVFFQFDAETLTRAKQTNSLQYHRQTLELRKQYQKKVKNLDQIEVTKQKLVRTKNLGRTKATQLIESAQNAIQIQYSNQFIQQQPNRFPYKLHKKYFISSKSSYQIFILEKETIAFKINYKEQEFEQFKKYVLEQAHQKGNYLISASVLKENSEIKKEFWKLLFGSKKRDQHFLINLSGINNKKTVILSLKENVTEDQIMDSGPFLFKDLEKRTNITKVVAVIHKQNYKQFQTDSKAEVIDLTYKKK